MKLIKRSIHRVEGKTLTEVKARDTRVYSLGALSSGTGARTIILQLPAEANYRYQLQLSEEEARVLARDFLEQLAKLPPLGSPKLAARHAQEVQAAQMRLFDQVGTAITSILHEVVLQTEIIYEWQETEEH